MRWYVVRNGQSTGPYEEADVVLWVQQGMTDAQVVAETGGPSMSILQSPFAAHAPTHAVKSRPNTLAIIAVVLVGVAFVLVFATQTLQSAPVPPTHTTTRTVDPPVAQPAAPEGIGRGESDFARRFGKIGYVFDEPDLTDDGERRVSASNKSGQLITLIGSASNLSKASIMMAVTEENAAVAVTHLIMFLDVVDPTIQNPAEMFHSMMNDKSERVVRVVNGRLFTWMQSSQIGMMTFIVEPVR